MKYVITSGSLFLNSVERGTFGQRKEACVFGSMELAIRAFAAVAKTEVQIVRYRQYERWQYEYYMALMNPETTSEYADYDDAMANLDFNQPTAVWFKHGYDCGRHVLAEEFMNV
jgi:hypothetical protein